MLSRQRALLVATTFLVLAGCGSTPTTSIPTAPALAPAAGTEAPAAVAVTTFEAPASTLPSEALEGLPPAPWSVGHVEGDAVPGPLLMAWSQAANRTSCAPLTPTASGAAEGAEPRVSELIEGGWAVEFDRRGMPGMNRRGAPCARCGRGVFGIAGTSMDPEQLAQDDADGPTPTFADGSHLELEASEGEPVAAATLTVRGQGCVYQVWSFLGEEHVRQVVEGLRLVDVSEPATPIAAR